MNAALVDEDGAVVMKETQLYQRGRFSVVRSMSRAGDGALSLMVGGDVVFAADFDTKGRVVSLADGEKVDGTEALRDALRAFMVAL